VKGIHLDPPGAGGRVRLRWEVTLNQGSVPLAGFRVYRECLATGSIPALPAAHPAGAASGGPAAQTFPTGTLVPLTPGGGSIPDSLRGPGVHSFVESSPPPAGTYRYWVEAVPVLGTGVWLDPQILVVDGVAGELLAWPNPTTGPLQISFELPAPGTVGLWLCDITGRRVLELSREQATSGQATWVVGDLRRLCPGGLPAGVYYLKLRVGTSERLTRVVLGSER
jgi:hypothetical protein